MNMNYLVVLFDGMADYPLPELGNKTPLEAADAPNLKGMAKTSEVGMIKTVADGMKPGSDVANLSVLGYDPFQYYTGRSPLEAGSIGIDMKSTDIQAVTSDRATLEVLNETFFTYLGGLNYFTESDAQSKLTYAELKEHIGVDCSEYQYDEEYQRGVYTWYANEDDACCLSLFFGDNGKLIAAGAYNLSL